MLFLGYSYLLLNYTNDSSKSGLLSPGKYEIECFGAQGGTYSETYRGGPGAYARVQFKVTNTITYTIQAGMQGQGTFGGLPDGGDASDKTNCGGGGSSRAILSGNLIIVAAGGSGSNDQYRGAPGGGNNTYFLKKSRKNIFIEKSDTTFLMNSNYGGKAIDGSGGGAGCLGGMGGNDGTSITSVGASGTSCITPSGAFILEEIYNGQNKPNFGNGSVQITYDYLCISNCVDCDDGSTCNTCDSSHVKYMNRCDYQSCPISTYQVGTECFDCPAHCENCSDSSTCNKCVQGFFMKGNECVSSCDEGFYQDKINRVCAACSVSNCNSCSSKPSVCDACNNPFVLYNNNCEEKECPSHYFNHSFICYECSMNCLNCSSKYECTACRSSSFRINKSGNCTILKTESYRNLMEIQSFSRRIQKNRNN